MQTKVKHKLKKGLHGSPLHIATDQRNTCGAPEAESQWERLAALTRPHIPHIRVSILITQTPFRNITNGDLSCHFDVVFEALAGTSKENDSKMRSHPEMIPEWSQNDPGIIPELFQNDPGVFP